MTLRGVIISFFPLLMLTGASACLIGGLWFREPVLLAASLVWLYVIPLLAFRIHQVLCPIKLGGSHLANKGYSGWYGAHQIQLIYLYLPGLERVLRMIPGVFSLWLRLWGSKIGKRIYWTPHFEISDRSLI